MSKTVCNFKLKIHLILLWCEMSSEISWLGTTVSFSCTTEVTHHLCNWLPPPKCQEVSITASQLHRLLDSQCWTFKILLDNVAANELLFKKSLYGLLYEKSMWSFLGLGLMLRKVHGTPGLTEALCHTRYLMQMLLRACIVSWFPA